ncbi:MAG: metallophosphatase family protein [Chloroflexi bacterium]|nr:MAG: metallophosphatase family protein [Chloroflexota bacterium]
MWPRVVDIEAGTAVVVTDLHGDWDAYQRYLARFFSLHARGHADYLIITGDFIHHSGTPETDKSLDITLDLIRLKSELGDRLICLLGNHELPHLYSFVLRRGNQLYTPRFESAMGEHRTHILAFFDSLPFYVRTKAGVVICHAGAAPLPDEADGLTRLLTISHKKIWLEAATTLSPGKRLAMRQLLGQRYGRSYDTLVREYLAITSPEDPRYDNFLIGHHILENHPNFPLLWTALFTRNEIQYGHQAYYQILKTMLDNLSTNYHPQQIMISGHIDCPNGYKIVNQRQLRLASAKHANPRESGCYLLLDTNKPVKNAEELLPHIHPIFKTKNQ